MSLRHDFSAYVENSHMYTCELVNMYKCVCCVCVRAGGGGGVKVRQRVQMVGEIDGVIDKDKERERTKTDVVTVYHSGASPVGHLHCSAYTHTHTHASTHTHKHAQEGVGHNPIVYQQ